MDPHVRWCRRTGLVSYHSYPILVIDRPKAAQFSQLRKRLARADGLGFEQHEHGPVFEAKPKMNVSPKVRIKTVFVSSLLAFSMLQSAPASAFLGEQFASQAKISLKQARRIALKAYPGKITSEELEKEAGGTGLRYSFDIRSANTTHEVGVDAKTGKILENSKEGTNPD